MEFSRYVRVCPEESVLRGVSETAYSVLFRLSPPSSCLVTFRLSPRYGIPTAHGANEWFLEMMYEHEWFEVETDRAGEPPLSFWSETVRGVMVE